MKRQIPHSSKRSGIPFPGRKGLTLFVFLFSLFIFIGSPVFAQTLPVPRDVLQAYKNQTRDFAGKPGKNYWQNRAEYKIDATLNIEKKTVEGTVKIEYFNNSPDSLSEIVLRLYQNFYKKGAVRNFSISPGDVTDGVDISYMSLDGFEISLEERSRYRFDDTHLIFFPELSLQSGKSSKIEVKWSFKVPEVSRVRMGSYDSSSFFIALWYPQVAVYDDVFGWDKLQYNGETEYYNDINDYIVNISVPSDFCVWATGDLINAGDIFPEEIKKKYDLAARSDTIVKILDSASYTKPVKFRSADGKTTWKFKADGVPDFAFGTSNKYYWDASSMIVKPGEKRVMIHAAYNPVSKDFYEVAYFARYSIDKFSNVFPGIPYPYPVMTVFNGGGGMEFPMIVNNGSSSSRAGAIGLTAHEIAHTYFPFYMGINEKRYAWMDEGWAVLFPFEIQLELAPENDPRIRNAKSFASIAGTEYEVPLNISTYHARGPAYRNAAYSRPACAYYFLRDYLGNEKFDGALKEFVSRWNGKHPIPSDFFFTFEDHLRENLSWYWKPWFFSTAYPEVRIDYVKQENDLIKIKLVNTGKLPLPVPVKVYDMKKNVETFYFNSGIWRENPESVTLEIRTGLSADSVMIGDAHIPDIELQNNYFKIKK
ncbi:MAG: M1 family metallopeptidase [Ignavibacteriaceae bacterium]|nr:M1 family metallopeptidase [Ignavibacteriaceae bacterium]